MPTMRCLATRLFFFLLVTIVSGFSASSAVAAAHYRCVVGHSGECMCTSVRHGGVSMGTNVKTLTAAPPGAAKPKAGDIILCHYTGWLKTSLGGKGTQFDSSRGGFGPFQKPPFKFALGRNRVIRAWDVGIAKMRVGETALLTCSSDMCYGRDGAGPIPPDADLLFEVELIAIDGYQPNLFEQRKG